jgi:hypothetical protein
MEQKYRIAAANKMKNIFKKDIDSHMLRRYLFASVRAGIYGLS